jgi:hypothetical protein
LEPEPLLEEVGARYPIMRPAGSGVGLKVVRTSCVCTIPLVKQKIRIAGNVRGAATRFDQAEFTSGLMRQPSMIFRLAPACLRSDFEGRALLHGQCQVVVGAAAVAGAEGGAAGAGEG